MRFYCLSASIISALICTGCGMEYETEEIPVISITSPVDTAFLHTFYSPEPGRVNDGANYRTARISGNVNTSQAGTYYLDYDYTDLKGKKAATVTKTVHVKDNAVSFLNGFYDAICHCTVTVGDSGTISTTHTYSATITPHNRNHHFELSMFYIGAEYVNHWSSLDGRKINIHFFSPDYDYKSAATGTLSAGKDSLIIQSTAYRFFPAATYSCLNIFTRSTISIISSAGE